MSTPQHEAIVATVAEVLRRWAPQADAATLWKRAHLAAACGRLAWTYDDTKRGPGKGGPTLTSYRNWLKKLMKVAEAEDTSSLGRLYHLMPVVVPEIEAAAFSTWPQFERVRCGETVSAAEWVALRLLAPALWQEAASRPAKRGPRPGAGGRPVNLPTHAFGAICADIYAELVGTRPTASEEIKRPGAPVATGRFPQFLEEMHEACGLSWAHPLKRAKMAVAAHRAGVGRRK